ncbi:MAG: HD-GYP domain-containing protein [Gemmatimonadales bacterium]|nr:HD-GYP domain-containing protein [Gemmatimonadales bacterium]
MSQNRAVQRYVVAVATSAAILLAVLSVLPRPEVDYWALFSLGLVGCLLEISRTAKKSGSMAGSLVFIMHLAIGVALGAMWGAVTAAVITCITQAYARVSPLKIAFNVSERVASVGLAFGSYFLLGGKHPPKIFLPASGGIGVPFDVALREIAVFLAAAVVYFIANSIIVNTAVALSTKKHILSTWRSNTLWVLGYDIVASLMALAVAYVFVRFNNSEGVGRFGFVAVFLPFIAVRHVYGKLNTLEDVYRELDQAYDELALNVREQLSMMVKAIEARDPYTSGHSRRVCGLSRAIATDLGLPPEHIEEIENAALLHDVGKIHEEFAPLLQKEGKLTDEEWAVMKTHSAKSAELVSSFSRFQGYVVSCVRHHHERWDGRGYPDGIAGQEIPLGARIITIADTIDAMTTNRPYRNALPLEVVLSELNKGRSTQFDAELVELTVNSVTVRRLISDPSLIPEHMPEPIARSRSKDARRMGRGVIPTSK